MQSENVFQMEVYRKHKGLYLQDHHPPQLVCELSLIFGRHGVVQMPFLSQQAKIFTGL